jgi:hypothetical protein
MHSLNYPPASGGQSDHPTRYCNDSGHFDLSNIDHNGGQLVVDVPVGLGV